MSDEKKTLYERLGGYDAIAAVANDLLPRLQADPQLGRFWAHRGDDGVQREKQLLIDFLCASAGGPVYYRGGEWSSAIGGCALVRATGASFSVTRQRPWRSSRFPSPSSAMWLRLSRVSRKRSSNSRIARFRGRPRFYAVDGITCSGSAAAFDPSSRLTRIRSASGCESRAGVRSCAINGGAGWQMQWQSRWVRLFRFGDIPSSP